MSWITAVDVSAIVLLLVCLHINCFFAAVAVSPGKVVSDQHFQKFKLSQAKATFDMMRAGKNAEKSLHRNLMPGHAYRWYDREHNWDRVHFLIDWAEGRPQLSYQELKKKWQALRRKAIHCHCYRRESLIQQKYSQIGG